MRPLENQRPGLGDELLADIGITIQLLTRDPNHEWTRLRIIYGAAGTNRHELLVFTSVHWWLSEGYRMSDGG